jgi:hypothetical protein
MKLLRGVHLPFSPKRGDYGCMIAQGFKTPHGNYFSYAFHIFTQQFAQESKAINCCKDKK